MARTTLIGIDVGTTAVKAVLLDESGNRLAQFAEAYPVTRSQPGFAEQNPSDWLRAVFTGLQTFARDHDVSGLRGIGICSQVNTHVFLGEDGVPLLPAITWQDTRSALDAAALEALTNPEEKTRWFGGPMPIDASHALARMAYVRRVHPEIWARTRHVLLPKDFIVFALTGSISSDPVSAVGLTNSSGYVTPLLDLVPGATDRLPPLSGFTEVVGRVGANLPCAGAPVVVGAMDAWGGMFGVGVVRDGDAMYQSGTSEIAGIVSTRVNPTRGVILFPPYKGIVMHAAPTQTGGAALAWLGSVLGRSPAEMSGLAASIAPSSAVPLFLPHLQGERAPVWDSASRAVFARLDNRAGAAELVRSVMEGVAFSVRWAFDALKASSGLTPDVVNIGGGGSRSEVWCQIRADALGMTLRRTSAPESAAIGAAILAGVGAGIMPSIAEAARELVQFDRTFEPDRSLAGYYDEKFGKYLELYKATKPING